MNHSIKVKCALSPVALATFLCFSPSILAQETEKQLDDVETIEVRGIRASVTKALSLKRTEVGVSDAISSDDIASFPDENIAESIQRIPGIQIQRSNGRGALISIRGLGPEYASTTLNGQSFASAQFNGGFRYDIVQSELASEIQVYKTPSASLEEGGLSGAVNIGTAKPLRFDGRKVLMRAEGIYSGDRDSTTPGAGITFIDQTLDGKLGYLFNAGYQELDTRYDLMFSQRFSDVDLDGDGSSDYSADGIPLERTDRPRLRREDGNTKRYLFSGAVQYLATDDLELNLTSVFAIDNRELFFQQLVPLFSGGDPSPQISILGQTDNTINHVYVENLRVEGNHTWQQEDRESYAITGDFDWQATENLNLKGVLHYTSGEYDMIERARIVGIRSDFEVDMDVNNPQFTTSGATPFDDPNSWAPENLFRNDLQGRVDVFSTDELAAQLDIEYFLDNDVFHTVKAGVKHRIQTLETNQTRYNANYRDDDIANAPFARLSDSHVVVSDFSGGEFPGISVDYVLPNIVEAVNSFGKPEEVMDPIATPNAFFEIDRDITTVYAQLDFSTDKLRGNAGVRYAYTDRTVNTLDYDAGIMVTDGALITIGGGSGEPSRSNFDYDNVLPSINLAYDLTDDIVLRASAGKVLVRPIIGDSATFSRAVSSDTDGTNTFINVSEGSAELPALTANQFDLSAEWYFNDSGALTLAYFKKDVKNQIRSETVCPSDFSLADVSVDQASGECLDTAGNIYNINRNRVSNGILKINGYELAYSQAFDFLPAPFNGLGVIANYTSLDAENPDELQPLLGSSETTYNLVGYYENDRFSVRVALNHRSEYNLNDGFKYGISYAPSASEVANPGSRLDARNQIDISLGYEINDHWKASLEGINVNGDYERGRRFESARLQSIATFGATYFLKLRYNM